MLAAPLTIAIPVGSHPSNVRWLRECLGSIAEQSVMPDEVLLIDDGAHLDEYAGQGYTIWTTPWRSGVAHAFNYGVALARNDLVLMVGSDDRLMSQAVEACYETWKAVQDAHGYYYLPVVYSHDGHTQHVPCNAAMVHKSLWHLTGGFPIEGAVGACDTMLINSMWCAQGRLGTLYPVGEERYPLYWYRSHDETDTVTRRKWHGVVAVIRNILADEVINGGG